MGNWSQLSTELLSDTIAATVMVNNMAEIEIDIKKIWTDCTPKKHLGIIQMKNK